jgi:hypothetical protein
MSLLLAQGLASASSWLTQRLQRLPTASPILVALITPLIATLATITLLILFWGRLPDYDLRSDHAAQDFLSEAATTLQPGSLVVSSADASTFALWYGAWGSNVDSSGASGSGTRALPDAIFVNYALYEFGWYRELMHDLYPQVPKMGASFAELIAANQPQRPIYFTEPVPEFQPAQLTATGSFWQLKQP